MTFFELMLIGHLVGDYLLQNNWMAQRKGAHLLPCVVHCLIYTMSVCVFTSWSLLWITIVFASHFPIDRFGLADKWLALIGSRSLKNYYERGHLDIPLSDPEGNYVRLRGGFTALVYAVADNTMHLLIMLLGAWLLGLVRRG